jgi:adenylate cyclase
VDRERMLRSLGIDDEEVAATAAEGAGALGLLLAGRATFPGRRRHTARQVWEQAGVDQALARELWLAMGLPRVPDDDVAFTDADIEILVLADGLFRTGGIDRSAALQQTRTMSRAVAAIAETHLEILDAPTGTEDVDEALDHAADLAASTLPALDQILAYLYRRHLAAAAERRILVRDVGHDEHTVGFADLVGFTAVSQELDEAELGGLIERFSALAADAVAEHGGRVVKMIGDEVMFGTDHPRTAATIAFDLLNRTADSEKMLDLRVGFATGPVLQRHGDLYGQTVNLAHRLVSIAIPGTVLVNDVAAEALAEVPQLTVKSLRPRRLKGFGSVRSYVLRPSGARPD